MYFRMLDSNVSKNFRMFQELSNVSKNVRILKFEIKTKQAWEILTQPKENSSWRKRNANTLLMKKKN